MFLAQVYFLSCSSLFLTCGLERVMLAQLELSSLRLKRSNRRPLPFVLVVSSDKGVLGCPIIAGTDRQ